MAIPFKKKMEFFFKNCKRKGSSLPLALRNVRCDPTWFHQRCGLPCTRCGLVAVFRLVPGWAVLPSKLSDLKSLIFHKPMLDWYRSFSWDWMNGLPSNKQSRIGTELSDLVRSFSDVCLCWTNNSCWLRIHSARKFGVIFINIVSLWAASDKISLQNIE